MMAANLHTAPFINVTRCWAYSVNICLHGYMHFMIKVWIYLWILRKVPMCQHACVHMCLCMRIHHMYAYMSTRNACNAMSCVRTVQVYEYIPNMNIFISCLCICFCWLLLTSLSVGIWLYGRITTVVCELILGINGIY